MRRSFEQIPQLAQQELGVVCSTQPILEGSTLCLEIDVPASDPDNPVRYRGVYRFYDGEEHHNISLTPKEIRVRRHKKPVVEAGQSYVTLDSVTTAANAKTVSTRAIDPTAQDTEAAVSNESQTSELLLLFSQLASQFEQAGGRVTTDKEKRSVTFEFTQQEDVSLSLDEEGLGGNQQGAATSIRPVDPDAKTFAGRSIAAANDLDLTSTDEYILRVLNTNGRATAPRIAEVLGISESTVRRSFRRLKDLQLIVRVGSSRAGYWRTNR